ncbi:MAG: Crp/Fnr family transcriptional regulator [Pyrinomonadaceae bacterium]
MMADKYPLPVENRLLASLPDDEHNRLLRYLEPIYFARKRILYEAGQSMRNAYFFHSGMASLFAVAEDGRTVQIAVVGSDGFVGVPIILMGTKTPIRIVTQTPVDAVKIAAEQLVAQFNQDSQLRQILLRYSQVLQTQMVQSALCNPLHSIRQRLCRLLLVCRDSTHSDSFDLTQEDMANMLGNHRNQISIEARELGKQGLIQYARGRITILDKNGLEHASCECHRTVRQWIDELLDV